MVIHLIPLENMCILLLNGVKFVKKQTKTCICGMSSNAEYESCTYERFGKSTNNNNRFFLKTVASDSCTFWYSQMLTARHLILLNTWRNNTFRNKSRYCLEIKGVKVWRRCSECFGECCTNRVRPWHMYKDRNCRRPFDSSHVVNCCTELH